MTRLARSIFRLAALIGIAAIAACASTEHREYARQLQPLVGQAPASYFIERYGPPEQRKIIDTRTEVLDFRVDDRSYPTVGSRGSIGVSTRLRLTFKDGVLAEWDAANAMR